MMSRPGLFSYVAVPVLWLCILGFAGWMYWPGSYGPAMLDDSSSLAFLKDVSEDNLSKALISDYVFGDTSGPLGRPVSIASFVVEKVYLDGGVAGHKQVNIVLHLLNGSLVLCFLMLILRKVKVASWYWFAILGAAFWLLTPLQVSTVLYSVQRMAMLATTFSLLAMIVYFLWRERLGESLSPADFAVILVPLLIIIGMFAKENAVVTIPILISLEILFFSSAARTKALWLQHRSLKYALIFVFLGCVLGLAFIVQWAANGYGNLPFTMKERVLTQSWILWDYIGQFLFPDIQRMGVFHDDIQISASVAASPRAFYSLLAWAAVLVAAAVSLKTTYGKYFVFGLVFFLFGHSLESSIFALEPYYEHRNYLPSVGLVIILTIVVGLLATRWVSLKGPMFAWLYFFLLILVMKSSSQVQVWSSERLFYLQSVVAHPESHRANTAIATQAARSGALATALRYSSDAYKASVEGRAIKSETAMDWVLRDLALQCVANHPFADYALARLIDFEPGDRKIGSARPLHILVRLLQQDQCPGFPSISFGDVLAADYLDSEAPPATSADVLTLMAMLENGLGRYDYAYAYVDRVLMKSPNNTRGLLMQLHFTTALGKVAESASLKEQLQALQAAGKLTIADQQTLALYLE